MVKAKRLSENLFRISRAAEQAGVSKQTVEYYLMLGLVAPIRVPGAYGRLFDRALVRRIRMIRHLNRTGLSLSEIRQTYIMPHRTRQASRKRTAKG